MFRNLRKRKESGCVKRRKRITFTISIMRLCKNRVSGYVLKLYYTLYVHIWSNIARLCADSLSIWSLHLFQYRGQHPCPPLTSLTEKKKKTINENLFSDIHCEQFNVFIWLVFYLRFIRTSSKCKQTSVWCPHKFINSKKICQKAHLHVHFTSTKSTRTSMFLSIFLLYVNIWLLMWFRLCSLSQVYHWSCIQFYEFKFEICDSCFGGSHYWFCKSLHTSNTADISIFKWFKNLKPAICVIYLSCFFRTFPLKQGKRTANRSTIYHLC